MNDKREATGLASNDIVGRLWTTFERRALAWEADAYQKEIGQMVAKELRTVNNAWRDAMTDDDNE